MSQVESARQSAKSAQVPTPAQDAPQGSALKRSLRGQSFAEQEEALSPKGGANGELAAGRAGVSQQDAHLPAPEGQVGTPTPTGDTIGTATVLSRDPTYTRGPFVTWFSQQVQAKATTWGVTSSVSGVRVAKDAGGNDAMVMDWPGAWGSAPLTKEMPDLNFGPIEAKLAVIGARTLSGWSKLPGSDQSIVEGLLGGETNGVSGAARRHLGPLMPGLATKPEEEQAAALSGVIGNKSATPGLVGEAVQAEPVAVALGAPTVKKNFDFRGKKADAEIFVATFGDGVSVEIVAPKAPEPGYHQHTVAEVAESARYVPKNCRQLMKQVVLNTVENPDDAHWAVEYNTPNFRSYMTAGAAGIVTVYPSKTVPQPAAEAMRGTLIHETGHTWSYKTWGNDKTKGKWGDWKACMDKDRVSVSGYAMNDIAEDVAETVQVYGSVKGTPKYEEYKAIIPSRLAMLEKEMG
jgi:hypothetical protein